MWGLVIRWRKEDCGSVLLPRCMGGVWIHGTGAGPMYVTPVGGTLAAASFAAFTGRSCSTLASGRRDPQSH